MLRTKILIVGPDNDQRKRIVEALVPDGHTIFLADCVDRVRYLTKRQPVGLALIAAAVPTSHPMGRRPGIDASVSSIVSALRERGHTAPIVVDTALSRGAAGTGVKGLPLLTAPPQALRHDVSELFRAE